MKRDYRSSNWIVAMAQIVMTSLDPNNDKASL
jgi:hypothetical protein